MCHFVRRRLASVGADGQLRVVDLETARCLGAAILHKKVIQDVSWDCSGRYLYTVGSEGDVVCSGLSCLSQNETQNNWLDERCVVARFSHNGDSYDGEVTFENLYQAATAVCAPVFTGQYFLTGGYDEMIRQWDVRKFGAVVDVRGHDAPVASLEFSHDDTLLVSAGLDAHLRLWDTTGLDLLRTVSTGDAIPLAHAVFSSSGRYMLSLGCESNFCIWDITSLDVPKKLFLPSADAPEKSTKLFEAHCSFQSAPSLPSLERPFVGHTALEYLAASGPFVYGSFCSDAFVIIPIQPTSLPLAASRLNDVMATTLGVWSVETGDFCGAFPASAHEGYAVTSVACLPTKPLSRSFDSTLVATSGT